jgi:hypothetical protein
MKQDSKVFQSLKELLVEYLKAENISVQDSEEQLRELLHEAGGAALGERWTQEALRQDPHQIPCDCGREIKHRQITPKTILTLLGTTTPTIGARVVEKDVICWMSAWDAGAGCRPARCKNVLH